MDIWRRKTRSSLFVVEFYKNKRTVREIAKRFGLMPAAVAGRLASAVRKLYQVTFRIGLVGLVSIK